MMTNGKKWALLTAAAMAVAVVSEVLRQANADYRQYRTVEDDWEVDVKGDE